MSVRLFDLGSEGAQLDEKVYARVTVKDGVFSVEVDALSAIVLAAADELWLEVTIGAGGVLPRRRCSAVPLELVADHLACTGCLTAAHFEDGGIGAVLLADGAITADKLGEPCQLGQVLKMTEGGWGSADAGKPFAAGVGLNLTVDATVSLALDTDYTDAPYLRSGQPIPVSQATGLECTQALTGTLR